MFASVGCWRVSSSPHLVLGAVDELRPLAGPGDCGFRVASDLPFEEGIATLGKASISEDLLEDWWRCSWGKAHAGGETIMPLVTKITH